jgi:phosphate butyryltransferase
MTYQPLQNWAALIAEAQRQGGAQIAVAMAEDPEVIGAARACEDLGLAGFTYIGDSERIAQVCEAEGFRLDESRVVHEPDPVQAARRAALMVGAGEADIIMKGKVNTADLVRAVLDRELGLRTGRLLSGTVVFEVPGFERLMVLSDASINIAPNVTQKAELVANAVETAQALGIREPKVAALTAFEFVNPEMPATVDAANLTVMAQRGQIKDAVVDGPIALDAAISAWAAGKKGLRSPVAGATDVFLCPNIESANIMLRAIIYFAGGKVGGIIQGARAPIILLSRAEPAETKVNSIALAVLARRASVAAREVRSPAPPISVAS